MHKHSVFIAFFLFIYLLSTLLFPTNRAAYAKEFEDTKPGYDIVFVLDVSASMKKTDKNRNSIEIIKMMIDMCTRGNTRIGFVAYNDTIRTHFSLADVSNTALRNDLKYAIDLTEFSGYTDMGLGLQYALKLISKSEDIGNHPIIILLSDGETDLSGSLTGRTNKDSEIDIANSITEATKNNIPLYTIGLLNDFNTNLDYLNDISSKTNGISYTATSPYQLVDIFNGILSQNTNSVLTTVENETATGESQYLDISVSDESLSELNIMLLSEGNSKVTEVLTSSEDVSIISSKAYQLIKVSDPVMETIRIKIKADKGSLVRVSTLGLYAFSDVTTIPDDISKQKMVSFSFQFYDTLSKTKVIDEKLYQDISLDFYIKTLDSGEETKYPAASNAEGFHLEQTFIKSGLYELRSEYTGDSIFGETKSIPFEVVNTPPGKNNDLEDTLAKEKGSKVYDVSELFYDADNDSLVYSIASSDSTIAKVSLSQNQLTVTPLKYGDTVITVEAADNDGGIIAAMVTIHSIPIWQYYHKITTIIVIGIIILIAAILSICIIRYFKKRITMPKPVFTGSLVGYFLALKNNAEIPPLKWSLSDYPNKGLSLLRLLKARTIDANLPETNKIWFSPKVGNSIELIHNTRCTVLVGSQSVPRNTPVTIHLGDKIYIAFEDMESELEIRYKN